jgi:hypothetical protein
MRGELLWGEALQLAPGSVFGCALQKWSAKGEDFTTKTLQLLGIRAYYLAI